MILRSYQQKSVDNIMKDIQDGCPSMLAVLPTGAGKTIVFSNIAKEMGKRKTLILAHREELIDQAISKLHAATGIIAQKEKAEHRASHHAPVVVASVQSMQNRLERWPADHFGLVICDEAHHSISPSWQEVLNHFKCPVLGVTATPDRGDKRNLGSFYQKVSFEIGLKELIIQGYLCEIKVKSVPLEIDLSEVKQTAGDYDAKMLASALDPYLDSIAKQIKIHAGHRKILSFLPLIATSQKFTAACNRQGISSMHINGKSENRKEILGNFANDKWQHLSNAMLLTEGYDQPDVDCIVILRPTRSRPLYSQMVGRGTRPDTFKDDLLLLDFLWSHERHNLIKPAHLVAESDDVAATIQSAMQRGGGDDEKDLMAASSDAAVEREDKLASALAANAKRRVAEVNVIEYCSNVLKLQPDQYSPNGGQEPPISEAQSDYLKRNKIDPDGVRGSYHASKLISSLRSRDNAGLATPPQVKLMKQLRHPNPSECTKKEATEWIGNALGSKRRSYVPAARRKRFLK